MITISNLDFWYPKGQKVLNGVSLQLECGNIYGLFGKNGEGKTSLMKILSGLLYPKAGEYRMGENHINARSSGWLQYLFLVPEDFSLPNIKVSTYEAINAPLYPRFSKERFRTLIQEFGLRMDAQIGNLSFGQQKKALIAFALATQTRFLFMDEPTNGLDIPSKSQFRKVMASIATDQKCIVISTHQVRDLYSLINHVIVLDRAQVAFDHSLDAVAEQLWFGKASAAQKNLALYSESGLGGKSILAKKNLDETEIDLELLFHGILNAPSSINSVLNGQRP